MQQSHYTLPNVDPNTNRIQTGQGYNYDNGGNLIQDADGAQFTFDGDNKQTEVKNASNVVIGKYFYDGNGKRVKKVTNAETTVFVYDGASKLIAEYSNAAPVQNPTVNYTATDPLGSPRVITNKQGEIVSRRDFMPFGEQLAPDVNYRTTNLKYNYGDNIRQKFTGYQRDEETGLDFAEARYYNNKHGRFTAVDPLLASGKSANPQTFNRYAYTMNRPLNHTDPTGLQAGGYGGLPTLKELAFVVTNRAAGEIGGKITNASINLSRRTGLSNSIPGTSKADEGLGTQVNAVRHTLWQAIITREFGAETATDAGNAHEGNSDADINQRTFTGTATNLADSDEVIDLNNNITGRQIGADNPNASNKELAIKVLEQYKNNGLYTATANKDGSVTIGITKLSKKEFDAAVKNLGSLNDEGRTTEEQKAKDARDKKKLDKMIRDSRNKNNEE